MFDEWDIRVQATAFIWGALAVIGIMVLVADDTVSNDVPVLFITALAAFLATGSVWLFADNEENTRKIAQTILANNADNNREKPKRHENNDARMDLLLRLMSEEEKESLKQRLQDELYADPDSEEMSLSALIDDEGELRRRMP